MQDLRNEYAGGSETGGAAERTWESVESKAAELSSEAGGRARRLKEDASHKLRSARQRVGTAYDRTAEQATRAYQGARGYAQRSPGVAVATTFAAGLGIGMLIGGRSAARAYRRGLLPAVAFALSQAVRDVLARR
jgi:ElaB/YqjD/DUF883 family membrane-anchored ribosome-binding protein